MSPMPGGVGAANSADTAQVLIERARQGDVDALGRLLNDFREVLHAAVCQKGWSSGLRARVGESDVVSETLLKAYRDFPTFRGTSLPEFRSWLLRILAHTAINFANHHSASIRDRRAETGGEKATELHTTSGESPSVRLMRQEELEQLKQALPRLKQNEQRVLRQHYFEQVEFKDIATRLGTSLENVYKLHQRGLQALQDLLGDSHGDRAT